MIVGQKHVVQCRCVVKMRTDEVQLFRFRVFSEIDNDVVKVKFVQCPNCGIVHKITDLCRSEILDGREDLATVLTLDDIKSSLPEKMVSFLEKSKADLSSWEAVKFAVDHKRWGTMVVITSEEIGSTKTGKTLIVNENSFRVEIFSFDQVIR